MKETILIRKLANGFLVHERTDFVANSDSFVFNSFDDLVSFLKKNYSKSIRISNTNATRGVSENGNSKKSS